MARRKPNEPKRLFSTRATSLILKDFGIPMTRYSVDKMIKSGKLKSIDLDGRIFVYLESIYALVREVDAAAAP